MTHLRSILPPALLYLAMRMVNSFAFALVLTYELAYHTAVVGLNPFQLVLVGVVLESMTLLFEIPTGVIADAYSRRLSVILGILLTGAGFLIETLLPSFVLVLLGQVVWGIGFTFYSGAETAWLTDELGYEQAHGVFLQATQLGQIASVVGTLLGAGLAGYSITLPILVGSVLLLLLGGSLILLMPERGFHPAARTPGQNPFQQLLTPFQQNLRFVRGHAFLWMILVLGSIIGLCVGGFDRLYTLLLLNNPAISNSAWFESATWLGLINGIVTVATLLGTEIVRRTLPTSDQRILIWLLIGLYAGMIIGTLVFVGVGSGWLGVAGFCLSQSMRMISRPFLLLWVNQQAEPHIRATVISSYWQANALGQIVGSPVIGWIAINSSVSAGLGVGILVYTLTIPLLLRIARAHREQQPTEN